MKQNKLLIQIFAVGVVAGFTLFALSSLNTATTEPQNEKTQPSETVSQNTDEPQTASKVVATSQTHKTTSPDTRPKVTDTKSPEQLSIRSQIKKEYVYRPLSTPNDPAYSANWALKQINAPDAWKISTGTNDTVIAVLDTGFGLEHEDLADQWALNSGETGTTSSGDACWTGQPADKSTNNCDDDGNGYIDDWRGWNFYYADNNPSAGRENPDGISVSHGTETAGLAGATGNNGLGSTSLSWNTKIMPLQVLSDDGPGYTSDVVAAVRYAVDNGADVINMSLGGDEMDPELLAATNYAYQNNVPVVAAAGNCGDGDYDCEGLTVGAISYPALNPHVISVGATNGSANRASFSSFGPGLDIMAPGSGSITTPTWIANNTINAYVGNIYGTSYASPIAASLVALIKSIRPNSTSQDITALLLASASKPAGMNGKFYTSHFGHGIVDASAALTIAQSLNNSAAGELTLHQTGGHISEHSFRTGDSLGSGCTVAPQSYCTIWMYDKSYNYERYLPYQSTDSDGNTGWSWDGSSLNAGAWSIRATQGTQLSNKPYTLINK